MEKGDLTTEDQPAQHIRLNIQSLTAVLMGYRRPAEMARIDRIQGSEEDIQALEKAIPVRQTYLMDFF
ncbi:sterol carrier protein domain-containing protein [Paenibacillus sp. CC-CFT742]|nr:sterol carrier protein domain-containing protein [Paenibacillus sp. CC-CFT742]WJH32013.1 sterol carrier protein domain-containing protein [Paenibacillus sp. CC-CFT742]